MRHLLLVLGVLLTAVCPAQIPELVVPTGHARQILSVKSDPAGGRVATSSIDETVKVWDIVAGRELTTFRPGHMARDLAFTADGKHLAVAAFNRIHLLRTSDWRVAETIDGWNTSGVKAHPSKNEIYYLTQRRNSTGEDPIRVFAHSVPGGTPRLLASVERGKDRSIARLDISPDGKQLLLVQDQSSHLIPISGGQAIPVPDARRFTPDGSLFFLNAESSQTTFGVRETNGSLRWELATSTSEIKHRNLVDGMGFHEAEHKFYWLNADGRLASGDYRSGQPTMSAMPDPLVPALYVTPEGILVAADKNTSLLKVYRLPSLANPRFVGELVLSPDQLAGSLTNGHLSWGAPGNIRTMHLDGRQFRPYGGPEGAFSSGRLRYAAEGILLSGGATSNDVFSYQDPTRHPEVKRFKSGFKDALTTASNRSGTRLVIVGSEGYLLMDTESNKSVGKGELSTGDARFTEDAALSSAGDRLLLGVRKYTGQERQTRTSARLIDLKVKQPVWELPLALEDPVFSTDGRRIYASIFENLVEYAAADGTELARHRLPVDRFPQGVDFDPDGKHAVYVHDNRAYAYDLATDREYPLIVSGLTIPFERITLYHDDFAVAAGREGTLRVFDLRNRKYVAALVRYADGEDWALLTPDGRFDASPGAMRRMYYRVNNELIALEQLFAGYYTPGLAAEVFSRLPAGSLPPAPSLSDLRPAPAVNIIYQPATNRGLGVEDDNAAPPTFFRARTPDALIRIKGDAPRDRITELRLYRNDKLLAGGSRNLIVEDDAPDAPPNGERTYSVRLLPGTNAFRAVALNSQGTESPPVYLTVDYSPDDVNISPETPLPKGSIPASGPASVTLHLVTVGIDRYANPAYNLNYATADAGALERNISRGAASLAGNIVVHSIRDAGATRQEIMEQLQKVVSAADADDLFVFFFAGHGIVPDPESGKFYLVPHDVTDPYGNTNGLTTKGLSAAKLQSLSARLPAERQLFLLDACQSGGAIEDITRGAAEQKAVASLARTTGTHWLTATDSRQLASEFDALGHGAFTYVLLEGLAGKAAAAGQPVTVDGLRRYLERTLPELTRRQTGTAQFPSGYNFGRDFIISR